MTTRHSIPHAAAIALIAAMLSSGCSDPTPEEQLASAKEYLAKKDDKAAVIELRNALQESPDLAEARFLLGKALLDSGDIAGAEKELRRALELQYPAELVAAPFARCLVLLGRYKDLAELARVEVAAPQGKAELMSAVGQGYLALQNFNAARNAFTVALTAQPKHVPAHLGLARISASGGNLAEASTIVDTAVGILPADPDALQLKGDIYAAQKQLEPALSAYRKAVQAKPAYLPAHTAIITLLMQEGRMEDADKQLAAMKEVAPNHAQTLYLQAFVAYRQKDFTVARQAIQQHLRVLPDNLRALVLAGAIEVELKSYAQAEAHLMKVLERAPRQRLARRILIVSYLRNNRAGKAMESLKPVLSDIDKDANMLALAGEVFMMNSDPTQAASYFAKAAALDPTDLSKRTAVALTHMATGESDRAYRELEQVSAIDSGIRADLGLIAGHMQRRQYDKALSAIAALEKKLPGSPLAHGLRGSALLAKRDPVAARRSFERALEIDPAYFAAAASLAQLDLADKKPDAARQRYERVIDKDPKNVQALLALAALRIRTTGGLDKPDSAKGPKQPDPDTIDLIEKAISAQPTEPTPRLALIGYYMSVNDPNKAAAAAQEAMAAMPDRSEILEQAGRAYQAAGDTLQAMNVYKKHASLEPASPQPYLHIAEIQVAAKNKDDAVESLRKALAIRPDLLQAQLGIIALHVEAGRVKEALNVAQEVQKQRPKEATGYVYEGDIQVAQKNWTEATKVYRTGLSRAPSTDLAIRLHTALAVASSAEADRFAATWVKEHPKDLAFRLNLAQAAGARKDYASAAQHYRKLLDGAPNNPAVLNNLAWAEGQLKDPKAIEHAEQANKLAPNQPAIMDTLGTLLVENGDAVRGVQLLQKASAMAPQVGAIRLNLARGLIKVGQKNAARKELDELAKLGDKFAGQAEVAQLKQGL
jgi:putative PEP-CTERM system TPR-repeat lipoprotein